MKTTTNKKQLIAALERAASVAPAKPTMPILAMARLDATTSTLQVYASDLAMSYTTKLDASGAPGSWCVNAKALLERVRMVDAEDVTLTEKDAVIKISARGSKRKFELHAIPGDEYPRTEPFADGQSFELPASALVEAITTVANMVCTDTTRLALNSMLFELSTGKLRTVATDGHRVSLATLAVENAAKLTFLLPQSSVVQARKFLDVLDGNVTLTIAGPTLRLSQGSSALGVKMVDAQFPPYEQVIPVQQEHGPIVGRVAFIEAIKAVSVTGADGVELTFTAGELALETTALDNGVATDSIDCEYKGKVKTKASPRYLLDALNACASERVRLELGGEQDPIVIRPIGSDSSLHVVMPMR